MEIRSVNKAVKSKKVMLLLQRWAIICWLRALLLAGFTRFTLFDSCAFASVAWWTHYVFGLSVRPYPGIARGGGYLLSQWLCTPGWLKYAGTPGQFGSAIRRRDSHQDSFATPGQMQGEASSLLASVLVQRWTLYGNAIHIANTRYSNGMRFFHAKMVRSSYNQIKSAIR